MTAKAQRQPGERGDTVLYVCGAEHNAPRSVCAPGDVHAGIVADVLTRDEVTGAPRYVLLALLVPELPACSGSQRAGRHASGPSREALASA